MMPSTRVNSQRLRFEVAGTLAMDPKVPRCEIHLKVIWQAALATGQEKVLAQPVLVLARLRRHFSLPSST